MPRTPTSAGFDEIEVDATLADQLATVAAAFGNDPEDIEIRRAGAPRARVLVPREAAEMMARVATDLASGRSVLVVGSDVELTPAEAARLLGLSRQFVAKLLDDGSLPSRRLPASRHRRIPLAAIREFQNERERIRGGVNAIVNEALGEGVEY